MMEEDKLHLGIIVGRSVNQMIAKDVDKKYLLNERDEKFIKWLLEREKNILAI